MLSNRSREVLKIFDTTRGQDKNSEFNKTSKYSSVEPQETTAGHIEQAPEMPGNSKIFVNASHLRNLSSTKAGGLPTSSSASMYGKSIFQPITARQTMNNHL